MILPRVVDGVLRNLHRQVSVADFHLAGQTRHAGQAPGAIKQILFILTHLPGRLEAFTDDDVAGRAGERLVARVFDTDVGVEHGRA